MLDAAGLSVVGAAEDIIDDLEYLHDLDTVKKYVSADGAFSSPGGLLDPSGCLTLTLTLFLSLSLTLTLTLTLPLPLTRHYYQNCAGPWAQGSGTQVRIRHRIRLRHRIRVRD